MGVVLYELAGIAGINYLGVSAFYMCLSVLQSFQLCTMATVLVMVQDYYTYLIFGLAKLKLGFPFYLVASPDLNDHTSTMYRFSCLQVWRRQ